MGYNPDAMRKLDHLDVMAARRLSADAINEVSLSRVWQHTQKAGEKSFGIVTSWRQALPKATNESRLKALKSRIRSEGLGFFPMIGHWQECQDTTIQYADCPKDQLVDAKEPTLFVPGIAQNLIAQLGNEYDQDSWLYAGPETDGRVMLFFRVGGETIDLGNFHPQRIAQAYSQLKGGAPFVFEAVTYGWADNMAEQAVGRNLSLLQKRIESLRSELVSLR